MHNHKIPSDILWGQVQDVLVYWGHGHEGLSECRLEAGCNNSYLLHIPRHILDDVLSQVDAIEDALEQLLLQHHIELYPLVIPEGW